MLLFATLQLVISTKSYSFGIPEIVFHSTNDLFRFEQFIMRKFFRIIGHSVWITFDNNWKIKQHNLNN